MSDNETRPVPARQRHSLGPRLITTASTSGCNHLRVAQLVACVRITSRTIRTDLCGMNQKLFAAVGRGRRRRGDRRTRFGPAFGVDPHLAMLESSLWHRGVPGEDFCHQLCARCAAPEPTTVAEWCHRSTGIGSQRWRTLDALVSSVWGGECLAKTNPATRKQTRLWAFHGAG